MSKNSTPESSKENAPAAWAHVLDMDALGKVIGAAESHVEDIESGLADGTYDKEDNEGLPGMQWALKSVSLWHKAHLPAAISANKDSAANFDSEYAQVCNEQNWSEEVENIHLIGFIEKTGLLSQYLAYAKEVAAEENELTDLDS
jgi:hypothetical protein